MNLVHILPFSVVLLCISLHWNVVFQNADWYENISIRSLNGIIFRAPHGSLTFLVKLILWEERWHPDSVFVIFVTGSCSRV